MIHSRIGNCIFPIDVSSAKWKWKFNYGEWILNEREINKNVIDALMALAFLKSLLFITYSIQFCEVRFLSVLFLSLENILICGIQFVEMLHMQLNEFGLDQLKENKKTETQNARTKYEKKLEHVRLCIFLVMKYVPSNCMFVQPWIMKRRRKCTQNELMILKLQRKYNYIDYCNYQLNYCCFWRGKIVVTVRRWIYGWTSIDTGWL